MQFETTDWIIDWIGGVMKERSQNDSKDFEFGHCKGRVAVCRDEGSGRSKVVSEICFGAYLQFSWTHLEQKEAYAWRC